jgi:hypothetical protein
MVAPGAREPGLPVGCSWAPAVGDGPRGGSPADGNPTSISTWDCHTQNRMATRRRYGREIGTRNAGARGLACGLRRPCDRPRCTLLVTPNASSDRCVIGGVRCRRRRSPRHSPAGCTWAGPHECGPSPVAPHSRRRRNIRRSAARQCGPSPAGRCLAASTSQRTDGAVVLAASWSRDDPMRAAGSRAAGAGGLPLVPHRIRRVSPALRQVGERLIDLAVSNRLRPGRGSAQEVPFMALPHTTPPGAPGTSPT